MAGYLYGTYGRLGESVAQSPVQSTTVPCYIGTAPVNLVKGYADKELVNKPVKLTTLSGARTTIGYSDDWGAFSLSEVIAAHFNNSKGGMSPVYVINVLDPATHKKDTTTTVTATFSGGATAFESDTVILDTIAIKDKTEGTDYSVDYNYAKGTVIINSLKDDAPLDGQVEITFSEVDTSKVTAADIIGGETADGVTTGLAAIELIYSNDFQVVNLLAAPGWDDQPEVYNALVAASSKINGHWDAFVYANLPVKDCDTISKAIKWKADHGYTSERSKVFWPMAVGTSGAKYHISTLAIVETMRLDEEHDGVPMETVGNKSVPVIKQYFGADSKNNGFGQIDANELDAKGIATVVPWAGEWVIWGDRTAAYAYGADVDARDLFDNSMRMLFYITNSFQQEWSSTIDKPMTRSLKDEIINREQEKLDYYVSIGALLGSPTIEFNAEDNTSTDIMNGNFVWYLEATPTVPLKSATIVVAYSDKGFSVLYDDGEEG